MSEKEVFQTKYIVLLEKSNQDLEEKNAVLEERLQDVQEENQYLRNKLREGRGRDRKRSRSLSPKKQPYKRLSSSDFSSAIHIRGMERVNAKEVIEEFKKTYGDLKDVLISPGGVWGTVVFSSEKQRFDCLKQVSSWEARFPGLQISPYDPQHRKQK